MVKPKKNEDGEEIPEPVDLNEKVPRECVLPDIKDLSEMITKDDKDRARQEQMLEVYSIKERLARDGCNVDLKTIKKALLIPDEATRVPGLFSYPDPGANLMKNPDPKKKKGKKSKKKKK